MSIVAGIDFGTQSVRVSIIERVTNAGGVARIDSAPGRGAVITLRWPAPKSASAREDVADEADDFEPKGAGS